MAGHRYPPQQSESSHGNSYSNMASTFLRRGLPDAAEEMLKKCPSIKNFTDKDFLDSKNPRFSGIYNVAYCGSNTLTNMLIQRCGST